MLRNQPSNSLGSTNSSSSSSLASGGKTSENFLYRADIVSVLACNELAELNSNRLILLRRRISQHTRKTSYVQRARWNRILAQSEMRNLLRHVGVLFTIEGRVEFFFQLIQCGQKSQETDILFISGLFKTATCRGKTLMG
jgi:hypothetical protein